MNLRDIDPKQFIPLGHKRKAILAERIGYATESRIIAPDIAKDAQMSSGIEPPVLSHRLPTRCRVLAIGPRVTGVKVGDEVLVPGAGNCYADLEDGQEIGSRLMIREGDIALVL